MSKALSVLVLASVVSVVISIHCYVSFRESTILDTNIYTGDVDMDCREADHCVKNDTSKILNIFLTEHL